MTTTTNSVMGNILASINQKNTAARTSFPARRAGNREVDYLIMARGTGEKKIGAVRWELNTGNYKMNRAIADGRQDTTYSQINPLLMVNSMLQKEFALRSVMDANDPKRRIPVRITTEEHAAISGFTYAGCKKRGETPEQIVAKLTSAPHMSDEDKTVMANFVATMEKVTTVFDVYFQQYSNTQYWKLNVPEGVELKNGQELEFHGSDADNGVSIAIEGLRATMKYKVAFQDGMWYVERPVGSSDSAKAMAKAKTALWDMLPKEVEYTVDDADPVEISVL